jgi:hypothetical protein
MDEQKEIRNQFRQQQEKYVYYIIAMSVAAIAFSISSTNGIPLKYTQIPLGIAVVSWGISIYCGLTFLRYGMSILFANNAYFDIINGTSALVGKDPITIELASKALKEVVEKNMKTGSKYFYHEETFFYIGVVSFIIWHVLEMYVLGIKQP